MSRMIDMIKVVAAKAIEMNQTDPKSIVCMEIEDEMGRKVSVSIQPLSNSVCNATPNNLYEYCTDNGTSYYGRCDGPVDPSCSCKNEPSSNYEEGSEDSCEYEEDSDDKWCDICGPHHDCDLCVPLDNAKDFDESSREDKCDTDDLTAKAGRNRSIRKHKRKNG